MVKPWFTYKNSMVDLSMAHELHICTWLLRSLEMWETGLWEVKLPSPHRNIPTWRMPLCQNESLNHYCLVVTGNVWNHGILSLSIYWECHNPNWLSYISEGLKPPIRLSFCESSFFFVSEAFSHFWMIAITTAMASSYYLIFFLSISWWRAPYMPLYTQIFKYM